MAFCGFSLLILEETITQLMNDGNAADVVYLDFAKAFASVNYRFLVAKLESFGLCEKVVRWIRFYLTGRTYKVQVANALSQETSIKSRVPQGSVIGPLLFLLLTTSQVTSMASRWSHHALKATFYRAHSTMPGLGRQIGNPVLLFPTPYQAPITQAPFTLSPLVLSQPLIHLS